jgi:hypothetical protein
MATVNASVVSAFNPNGQNFYSISYPGVNLFPNFIAGISKADPAVVTTKLPLPPLMVSGDPILITNVGGMTQLKTAGANGTNLFYVDILSDTTFGLYTSPGLGDTVNSTGFTTATANTGQYTTFTGAQYNSLGDIVPVIFPTIDTTVGTDISVDTTTGEITLAADQTYQIIVTGFPLDNPASQGGAMQLYDNGAAAQIGPSHPIGSSFFGTVAPTVESVYQILAVAPNGAVWTPPAGIQHAEITIISVSGASVA